MSQKIDSLIGRNTTIDGTVRFTDTLHVEGRVNGGAAAESDNATLVLGETGVIDGRVEVSHLVVGGDIHGEAIIADRVELQASAKINGNIHYRSISMAMGAVVNGELRYRED